MTAGTTPKQTDLWRGTAAVCEGRVGKQSIWAVLYREGDRLVGDELFADLFAEVGRRSVPPRIVATVMVLQRLQGLSDREAVEAFCFDARWKYACGGCRLTIPASVIPCWWTCGRGWLPRPGPSGSLRSPWLRPARLGWSECGGCWTPHRCMTRWRRWTPSRCWARPSGACSRWLRGGWRSSCEGSWPAGTSTPRRPSRRSIGTTRRPGRPWWMRAPGMPTRCWGACRPPAHLGGGRSRPAAGRGGRPGPGAR